MGLTDRKWTMLEWKYITDDVSKFASTWELTKSVDRPLFFESVPMPRSSGITPSVRSVGVALIVVAT